MKCLLESDVELIVIEESQLFGQLEVLKVIKESGKKVMVINQGLSEKEMTKLGKHYSVAINRSYPTNMEEILKIEVEDGEIQKNSYYNI